ncbi:hypothetical protein [Thiothrix nivea]|uniref:Cofactor-independent phosphoglycerate mutase n=1 Tax=Thiothrix nivea (strain ATCC 35100 / DSM 5205 / JP2) TaxID=870187 RepID=A0A656H9K0_THINJ|nr:hypothetical protein [Thiothrix nivea]EIJ32763.1 hypothetical protein Thini_0096 [Thiothrix nivea DSM 5205]
MSKVNCKNSSRITFYIPGLFQPLGLWCKDFAFQPVAENLLRLSANAGVENLPVTGLENTLFHCAGHPADTELPFARYRYQLDFGALPRQPLMCADPVFLQSGIDQVLLHPELPLISPQELGELLALLNRHLAEDGLQLEAQHPQRWYLLGERVNDPTLRTTPLSQVLGQGIFQLLPQGNKRYWHCLLNEIQMLLHTSGIPAVNGLWLWGASSPFSLPPLQKGGQGGFLGPSVTAQTLSIATDTAHQPVSKWAECTFGSGEYQIILDDLLIPSVSDNPQAWQQAVDKLEKDWFAPALSTMKSGQFTVSLTACDGRIFYAEPASAWKFWQKRSAGWEQLI